MTDAGSTAVGSEAILQIWLPLFLILLWGLARRRRAVGKMLDKVPYARALIDIALALAGAWSIGTAGEMLREALQQDGSVARPGLSLTLAMYLGAAFGVARLLEAVAISNERQGRSEGLSRLSRTFLYGGSLFFGLIAFFASNDFPKLTAIAGGAAALLTFALRQLLTDLSAGVALSIEQPFRRRDWVMLEDGTEAEVVDMDWRATHFRGWDRAVFLVPNSQLARQSIRILPRRGSPYAVTLAILVSGKVDPARVTSLVEQAVGRCAAVLPRPAPAVRLADASTVPYRYSIWVHFDGYMASFAGREEMFREIHTAFGHAGLEIAATAQDIRLERPSQQTPEQVATGSSAR